jgi:hypothetical protein
MRLDIMEEMQCVFSFKVDLRRKPRSDCGVYLPVIKRGNRNPAKAGKISYSWDNP